ncbi:amino acid permease [Corynebacterium pseudotuberculosis]|uniref:amino acid permease n=1 Tax=Corynebacterium pseudotuberculosis TaxID=1719 RepID=UPI0002660AFA|nr:amino acid permease [Corynebacterium pseudotuberculosis]AFM06925.1 amino acid permease [Corynebacterium pseudotuberculosis Cp162]APG81291.1 L-asparagine permease [Corynebacterium pseudotuberculosis]WFP67892.1 amino acid permease [Corynebacterium pseudotuberculosis]
MAHTDSSFLTADQEGYKTTLGSRHIQMMALGSAIGTGLFMGAGGRLATAGPSLVLAYLICGFFAFFILRAVGELVLYRASSGAVVSWTREFMGERAGFVVGWVYFMMWALTGIADTTAIAIYLKFWNLFSDVPQWTLALAALVIVLLLNLISVRVFGEMEFWFAMIKIAAICLFMAVAIFFVVTGRIVVDQPAGLANILDHGGVFPTGFLPLIVVISGVVFAYFGIELIGTAAGETKDAEKEMPKAVNSVIWRIIVFYCGSVLLLALVLPYTAYSAGVSPFVTFFDSIGVPSAGTIMNLVVITAALSSLNAGLYSTGRTMRTMARAGTAPEALGAFNKRGVPFGGIALNSAVVLVGVVINYLVPGKAFDIALNMTAICVVINWAFTIVCHMQMIKKVEERPAFRMPWAPVTNWLTLGFLAVIVILIASGSWDGFLTVVASVCMTPLFVLGWLATRGQVEKRREEHARANNIKRESVIEV